MYVGPLFFLSIIRELEKFMEEDNEYCKKHCKGYRDTGGRCFFDDRCDAYREYQKQKETMAKTDNRPKEKMRLVIEFADNGIILRNPECKDDIKLALTGDFIHKPGQGCVIDHSEEYKAIGKDIYDWLTEVVVTDHYSEIIATGAELSITATLNGRRK